MKPQNFRDCGGSWRLRHLGFFTNHLKLVNSIPVLELIWAPQFEVPRHSITMSILASINSCLQFSYSFSTTFSAAAFKFISLCTTALKLKQSCFICSLLVLIFMVGSRKTLTFPSSLCYIFHLHIDLCMYILSKNLSLIVQEN